MLTERLARFVVSTPLADIPRVALLRSQDAVIDTLGVGIAGTLEPAAEIAQEWAQERGGKTRATLWGSGVMTSMAEAAFANGIAAHALDFDDSLPSLRGHASAPLVATALAVGEALGASGAEVLAAYALGFEIAGKLGRAVGNGHYLRGWHTTSTVGTFSATAVAGRLLGLDQRQMQTAWGIAASQVSGLVRNFGTMTKPFHGGRAARAGVESAWLASRGFTADSAIFDGESSVLHTYCEGDGAALEDVVSHLGAPWEIVEPGNWVKRWPCCYCTHRAIGGVLKLREEHELTPQDIEQVIVGFLPGTDTPLISTNPQTGLEGKFSIEYTVAAALIDGKLTLESFTDPMVQRPAIRALMPKVTRRRIEDTKVYALDAYTDLTLVTRRGRYDVRVEQTPGSPQWPMTPADRREKFLGCADRVLGSDGAQAALDLGQRCVALSDVRALLAATAVRSSGKQRERDAAVPGAAR